MTPQGYPLFVATSTAADTQSRRTGRVIGWTGALDPVVIWSDDSGTSRVVEPLTPGTLWWFGDTANHADQAAQEALWFWCRDGHGPMAEVPGSGIWRCPSCLNAVTGGIR